MALAEVDGLTYAYAGAERPALAGVSLRIEPGEKVLVLGPSGGGKSTLLRALAGLIPHFHGGSWSGRVVVGGRDTGTTRPAELAGTVASVFQDPENQVVMTRVAAEVEFGLENLGTPPGEIASRARGALGDVGAVHLAGRRTAELSAGELQRVVLASALALLPELLLLDEPTSQLDPEAAVAFLELALDAGCAVVIAEQRPAEALPRCDRVLFVEDGRIVLDVSRDEAASWLAAERPAWLAGPPAHEVVAGGEVLLDIRDAAYTYAERQALTPTSLELRRGELVALTGPNGAGKTTLARLAAGLLEPAAGTVVRHGRASYLAQDPGRYVVCDRAVDEVALGVDGDVHRAVAAMDAVGLAGLEERHPRDLSSGERERLALASVLVTEPDVLILDEPTRGVDPARKDELAALLRAGGAGRATLVVTHDRAFAAAVADREVRLGGQREVAHV